MEPPTLDDLVKEIGISPTLLDQKCSDEHLNSISSFLDWRTIAPHLGLKTPEIDEIESKETENERRLAALQKWKRKYAFMATLKNLVKVLLKVDNADHAEQVCRLLKSQEVHTDPREQEQPETPSTMVETANIMRADSMEQPEASGATVKVGPECKDGEKAELELHKRRERELLLELRKKPEGKPPSPKQPRYQKEQELHEFSTKQGTFVTSSDCMFLASVGNKRPPGTEVVCKPSDEDRAQHALKCHGRLPPTPIKLPEGTEVDLVIVSRLMREHRRKNLVSLNLDIPGSERSKDYYLQEIEEFLKECEKPGATIWYTGHSEQGTGDWCFKDGTISIQEIFDLYRAHFSGRYLGIISDCCYSGKWVHTCAEMLDNMGIPPCGHKAREQGVMIKIFASCKPDQKAGDPCYSPAGVEFSDEDQCMYFNSNKQLTENQASIKGDFNKLVCCKEPGDACPAKSEFKNWKWADAVSGEMWINIRLARSIRGRSRSWYYVLLSSGDEERRAQFKAQAPGTLNVAEWGYVLASGSGKDPPRSIQDKIRQWTGVTSR